MAFPGENWQRTYFNILVAGSLLFVLVTSLFPSGLPLRGALEVFRWKLNLQGENGLASWWSGMLLLLGAVHAMDACLRQRGKDPLQAFGWGSFSALMVLLSLDEVGSMHERAASLLIAYGAALGLLACVAMLALLRSSLPFAHTFLLGFAFFLFACVAGQEYLQWNTRWWGEHDGLRAGLEEGTELIAMLIIIGVTLRNGSPRALSPREQAPFASVLWLRAPLVYGALVVGALLAWYTAGLNDHRGNPAMWVASSAFMLNALATLALAFQAGHVSSQRMLLILGSIAASAVTAGFTPPYMSAAGAPRLLLSQALFLGTTALLLAALWWRSHSRITQERWVLGAAFLIWLCTPFASSGWSGLAYCLVATCLLRVSSYAPELHEHAGQKARRRLETA